MSSNCSISSASLNEEMVVRKRNALACVECNRRKKKCVQDAGGLSCYYCSLKAIECHFPTRPVKRAKRKVVEPDFESVTSEYSSIGEDNDFQTKSMLVSNQEGNSNVTLQSSEITRQLSPAAPMISPFGSFEISIPSPKISQTPLEVQYWTHATFVAQNSEDGWIDNYYSHVFQSIPLMPKPWLAESLLDIPLTLLHTMYACTQLSKRPKLALEHYRQALKMQYDEFERADLLTIVTFLHFHFYEGDADISSLHFSNAVKFAILLELDQSRSYSWISPNGNLMGIDLMSGARFRTRIYHYLYIKECEMTTYRAYVVQLPDSDFESPFANDEDMKGSYLEHAALALPLVKVCRRIASEKLCDIIPPKERLFELESAWANISETMKFKCNDRPIPIFVRLYNICNRCIYLVFHFTRLKLMKPKFLLHVQVADGMTGAWIQNVINSAITLTQISKLCFLRIESDSVDLMLAPALQLAGLCHCVLKTPALDQILMLHFNALEYLSKFAVDEKRRVKPYLGTMERKLAVRMLSQQWI